MLRHERRHLWHVDLFGEANDLGGKIVTQGPATARSAVGTMLDNHVGVVAQDAAMTFLARLRTAQLGLHALIFAIRRGRHRGCASGLLWTLQS